jgi:hypothetical protein
MMSRAEHLQALLPGLVPVEVFDFYDIPRFYSVRDSVGQLYLVYWVDEDERGSKWLYLRVSQDRYASVKQGLIPISFALSNPEEGLAFAVQHGAQGTFVAELESTAIEPEWLPPSTDHLSTPALSLPRRGATALETARSSNRQVVDIAFKRLTNSYEIGCGKLGRLLEAVQNTIYAFACPPDRDIRRVPEEVKFNNEAMVTGLFASSFGVRLQSKGADLFQDDRASEALRTLSELVAALALPDTVAADLHQQNILARSRFKQLLRVLVEAEVSLAIDWGTPSGRNNQSQASLAEISRALQRLEATDAATTQIVERFGRLVGVDVQSNFFALVFAENEVIKGTLSPALAMRQFEVPSYIVASVQESCVVDPLTDREKWTFVLLEATAREA